jgi:tetratricopeptide (TPR) repeat protein
MSSPANTRAEGLRAAALDHVRGERYDEAIALYDQALAIATDDDQRELLTINKADAMLCLGLNGPEVQLLPMILMRRRNLHHTFLAAYALMYRHRSQNDVKRAIFYGEIALRAAVDADKTFWKVSALNDLGIVCEMDSQFERAIDHLESALTLLASVEDESERTSSEAAIVPNLAYNLILAGKTIEGLKMMHDVLDRIQSPSGLADSYIALCHGYVDIEKYEEACHYGEIGLALATSPREIRNAHYLIGEAAYKAGDIARAEKHFEELAKFYPEFRNLKSLLFAIDLRSMVNFRL